MYRNEELVALDFETYSDVDLRKQGLDNYVNGEHFRVLLAGLAHWDSKYGTVFTKLIDFVNAVDYEAALADLELWLEDKYIVAHNAAFEHQVLQAIGIDVPINRLIDTAVLARAAGYGGSLQNAATQALQAGKLEMGESLVKQYCVPSKDQVEHDRLAFEAYPLHPLTDWIEFGEYCKLDASLSLKLALKLLPYMPENEITYSRLTMHMNEIGWPVDRELVNQMNQQYAANVRRQVDSFKQTHDAHDLNLNSSQQLIAWCKERGVRVSSFDEKSVAAMIRRINKRLEVMPKDDPKREPLLEVLDLGLTKQALGGSSLKKLDVIELTTSSDGRLRNQYMHLGASATYRTSGRGVQMQNLKRLHGDGDDVTEVLDGKTWSNTKLAENLRQCFHASEPSGQLIVGDFSSVESRGLAWQASEDWKLDAYFHGEDLYKVQAANMFGVPISNIGKPERQIGKVAELSCGYGAGPGAVKDFADKMGVTLTEAESTKLVRDWRDANPAIVQYWADLDTALHHALAHGSADVRRPNMSIIMTRQPAPASLCDQVQDTLYSLHLTMWVLGAPLVERVIHGVHEDGRNLSYWKPSERKTGDPWMRDYVDPKTKQRRKYSVYGGKLSGILTQSLCRELFFKSLLQTYESFRTAHNVEIIGQFHDEIVLNWKPSTPKFGAVGLHEAKLTLQEAMTAGAPPRFPLGADIKSAYRYIK